MVVNIGDSVSGECTQVDHLPLQALRKDDDGKLELLPTPATFLRKFHDSTLENFDPPTGMDKVFNDNGLTICNTVEKSHPTPWGVQHTPFQLYVQGDRPIQIDIDWVSHFLLFGNTDLDFNINFPPFKLPDRNQPGSIGWFDLDYPFAFRDKRGNTPAPPGNPRLQVALEGKWFDEDSLDENKNGLDEGIHATDEVPGLTDENTFATFQMRVRNSFHLTSTEAGSIQTNDTVPGPWQDMRTITFDEANETLGTEDTIQEFETWFVFGTNNGLILETTGADLSLIPGGFEYEVTVVYTYSLP